MRIYRCTPESGWDGIADALTRVEPGDEVVVASGEYSGDATLEVSSGIKIRGEAGTVLEYAGQEAAIRIQDAEGIEISGIEILATASAVVGNANTDYPGLIEIETSRNIEIRGCACNGSNLSCNGVRTLGSTRLRVDSCKITQCASGILAGSTTGSLFRNNKCWGNEFSGIELGPDEKSKDQPSEAAVTANLCYLNEHAGIRFLSSNGAADRSPPGESTATDAARVYRVGTGPGGEIEIRREKAAEAGKADPLDSLFERFVAEQLGKEDCGPAWTLV